MNGLDGVEVLGALAGPIVAASPERCFRERERLEALVVVWDALDERRFRFLRAALGSRAVGSDWDGFRRSVVEAGVAEWDERTESLRHDPTRSQPPGLAETAAKLFEHWTDTPDPGLVADAVGWAVLLEAWPSLGAMWLSHLLPDGSWRHPLVVSAIAMVPPQARVAAPILTVARAMSRAHQFGPSARGRQIASELVADGLSLHSNWRQAPSIDATVVGAALWMLARRIAPGVQPSVSLDLTWAAQEEAAGLIDRERGRGNGPSAQAEALFRATSAQIALARGDLCQAAFEADYAAVLDPATAKATARGTGDLARELAGCESGLDWRPAVPTPCPSEAIPPGLAVRDSTSAFLASALQALRELDRVACDEALRGLGTLAPGATQWTVVLYVQAIRAALWGDPASALTSFDAAMGSHAMVSVEQHERLGSAMLRRARLALLDRLGASAVAKAAVPSVPGEWRWAAEAQSLLWAGECDAARRAADRGLFDPATVQRDRLILRVVRAAATALDPTVADGAQEQLAIEIVGECLTCGALLPLALLPASARELLLGLYRGGADLASDVEDLLARFERLNAIGGYVAAPIRLTRREKVLLPLLASDDAVPEIAAGLHVSPHTVRKQVVSLRKKFGAKNRTELVRLARDSGAL